MSKFLKEYMLPAGGAIALVLGVSYGVANRGYGESELATVKEQSALAQAKIAELSEQAAAAQESAAASGSEVSALQSQLAEAQAQAAAAAKAAEAVRAQAAEAIKAAAASAGGGDADAAIASLASAAAMPRAGGYGLGRPATENEVAAWNLDIHPDGTGLPEGSGDVWTGEEVFAEKCAVCHGDFAEGRDNWPKLAGGAGTLADKDPLKTVGSYWPYLSTTWDYVNRSMPFGAAQTLTHDEVYAIVAYILYSNDLVDDDFVLSNETFLDVEMPNADGFIIDDRATAEAHFIREPCMENCKEGAVEITMRAAVLDVTPEEEGAEEAAAEPAAEEPKAEEAAAEAPAEETAVAALDAELVKDGEKVFKKCKACHQVGDGAKNKTGPMLNGVMGAKLGHVDGFKYSKAMTAMGEEGVVWTDETLAEFLAKPKAYVKGTKMSFAGLKKDDDIAAVTEYLKSFSQ